MIDILSARALSSRVRLESSLSDALIRRRGGTEVTTRIVGVFFVSGCSGY